MKILITGAHGQLGQDLTDLCKKSGHEAISCGSQDLNITDYNGVLEYVSNTRPDFIVNCAAYNAVDKAETEWEKAFSVNGIGPKNLALVANKVGAVLVHYSTDYVFNGQIDRPYTIVDFPSPLSKYGESKFLGEQQVMRHAHFFYLIRVSWVFGLGNMNFVKKVLEWSEKQDLITVVDDQISSPTYTHDLAKVTLDLIKTGQYGLYHCTNAGYCSRYDFASYILQKIGWNGDIVPGKSAKFKTPAIRPSFSALDNFGITQVIGYTMPPWQDAVDRFLIEIGRL
ncbi:dTDP-4-dehydrorhamnose reductase [Methanospirillum sp. J.3.6.1-F.2.7.3]|uniref:dTDP-4-dehydrorhamnose reductase n=1 Tax=Methanospirillum purgamenti TaxID=2834276 RepID=A0A8E7EK89_9EURY|nr:MULTISPECIES: dTDP-4-dehydrorhamnose reductase [Methanospirillum]MDX8549468.1 dTDP-4-dehydrorhamnose reductase [Methanospirillum hungatei]QVV89250.1 dTDP-4-dehydrorhamnose reductase [Methanospirillum sp. J.3.6.1-F.2.7.3]